MSILGGKRALVIGCGAFGSTAASVLFRLGYKTTVIDTNEGSFDRLDPSFDGEVVVGDGTSAALLEKCGAKEASVMVCSTNRDTANLLASEVGSQMYGCPNVFARIEDEALAQLLEEYDVEVIRPHHAFVKEMCLQAGFNMAKAGL